MKKSIHIILLIALSSTSYSQLISNKYNIYFSYSFGNFLGAETINEDNYITPSLYSNYSKLSAFSVKGLLNSKEYLSYGINYDYQSAYEWTSSNYSDFENSEIKLHSITPLVRFRNKFSEMGFSNRFIAYGEIGPTIGLSSLSLSQSLFDIRIDDNNSLSHPLKDENIFWGIKGTIGLEYSFIQSIGCFLSYSYNMNWVSSKYFNDKTFKTSFINVGVVMKFNKNKYFYY